MKTNENLNLSVGDIQGELLERKALPIGRTQFMEWSDRIIKAAMVEATDESLRFTLAAMIMHLGPTEAFKEDGYFVLALRHAAVKETAHAMFSEIKKAKEERMKTAAETAPNLKAVDGVLENQAVQTAGE